MSPVGDNDEQLIQGVFDQNFDVVMAALEAGASMNGPPEAQCPPIVAATMTKNVGMVGYFLGQGADPDRSVETDLPRSSSGSVAAAAQGERALHTAGGSGNVENVRLLLKLSRADPNATDSRGRTPLIATCENPCLSVEVVGLMLEAGADPALADKNGVSPLHMAAETGRPDLVDMLYSKAPAMLNRCDLDDTTPLFAACRMGHESTVSKLLSLGAMQLLPSFELEIGPLEVAVGQDCFGVVRVLINAEGIWAVGGEKALVQALHIAIRHRRAKMLQLLLTADGEKGRLADSSSQGKYQLHHATCNCYPPAVSILLKAGADKGARDLVGRTSRDVVEMVGRSRDISRTGRPVAITRMLQRGPAYRARSWAWPSGGEADACGNGECGTAAAAVMLSPQDMNTPPVIGVIIFRPKATGRRELFVRLVSRYCAKEFSDEQHRLSSRLGGLLSSCRALLLQRQLREI